jgi:hypothetical protein
MSRLTRACNRLAFRFTPRERLTLAVGALRMNKYNKTFQWSEKVPKKP